MKTYFNRFLSVILVLSLILTVMPLVSAAADSNATAYNVYITGNFVAGQTLTANYTYYDPDGYLEDEDNVEIIWYCKQFNGAKKTGVFVGEDSNGNVKGRTVQLTDDVAKNADDCSIYFTVRTKNEFGYGDAVTSLLGTKAGAKQSAASNPFIENLTISPNTADGSMLIGDEIVAHYSYVNLDGTAEDTDKTIYKWYRRDSLNTDRVQISDADEASYTLTKDDFGKYIEVDVAPYAESGRSGRTLTSQTHFGNVFYQKGASKLKYAGGNIIDGNLLPMLFADGLSWMHETNGTLYNWGNYHNSAGIISSQSGNVVANDFIIDMGKDVVFDGFYLDLYHNNSGAKDLTISYAKDGADVSTSTDSSNFDGWTNAVTEQNVLEPASGKPLPTEYILDTPAVGRYIRLNFVSSKSGQVVRILDFYPYLSTKALPELELTGGDTIDLVKGESYTDPGCVARDAAGRDIESAENYIEVAGDTVDTDTVGDYEITYTLKYPGYPDVVKTRTVKVRSGFPTEGDLAYECPVTDEDGTVYTELTDGNKASVYTASAFPASITVDLGKSQYVSRFCINEVGNNVTGFTLSTSEDGDDYSVCHTGETLGTADISISPAKARYVKLIVTDASADVEISDFEVHLKDSDKLSLAYDALTLGDIDAIYKDLILPKDEEFGTNISWSSDNTEIVEIIKAGEDVKAKLVKYPDEETMVTLTATISNSAGADEKTFSLRTYPNTTPVANDVHIDGNFVVGQTLTVDYTYSNEGGIPEDGTTYQWYRLNQYGNNDNANKPQVKYGLIEGATGKSYKLTDDDAPSTQRKWWIMVKVTPKSAAGTDGEASWSAISAQVINPGVKGNPVAGSGYIDSLDDALVVGSTAVAHFTYQEAGGTAPGKSTYQWQTRDSADSPVTVVQQESTDNTYKIQPEDYGKLIECVITPKSADGTAGEKIIVSNRYGNAFLGESVTNRTGNDNHYYFYSLGIDIPLGKVLSFEDAGFMYTYASAVDKDFARTTIDAGRNVDFNAVYVSLGGSTQLTDAVLSYSTDGSNYTVVDKEQMTLLGDGEILLDNVINARYFRLYGKIKIGERITLNAFYPYLTSNAVPAIKPISDTVSLMQNQPFKFTDYFTATDPYGNDVSSLVTTSDTVNTSVLGDYLVTYTLTVDGFPKVSASQTFKVTTGIPADGDIAFGKDITGSGDNINYLVDGNTYTKWTAPGTAADVILNFGKSMGFSQIYLRGAEGGVHSVSVYGSDDGVEYTLIAENLTPTDDSVTFDACAYKYLKLSLNYPSPVDIHSVEVTLSEAAKADLAKLALILEENLNNITSDLALPKKGEYDTDITWSSSKPDVISTEGAVRRGNSDENVTLTATISNNAKSVTKTFNVVVKKKSSNGGGASAGGGSFGSSGGFTLPEVVTGPAEPPKQDIPSYQTFPDVPDTHWASDYINSLAKEGIVNGRDNGFEPDAPITRAEFLKLLIECLDIPASNGGKAFSDVQPGSWYYDYVMTASELSIVTGSDGAFMPDETILRRDMAVMAGRIVSVLGKSLPEINNTNFVDMDSVADYAVEAVETLRKAGIINGNENSEFMPDNTAARAEAVKIIYMLRESIGR